MTSFRSLYHIVRADFYERARSYGFLVTIVLTILAAYFFVPFTDAKYGVVMINEHRGVYNSAWIGATVVMSTVTILSLIGFALVKNAIDRDRMTRVGQIIATTPISKFGYLFGKFVSNFIVLAIIVLIAFLVSIAMQLIRNEDTTIQLLDLLLPFVLVALPVMALVAALAVLFESTRFLSGGAGIIVYFFLWSQVFLNYGVTVQLGNLALSSPMGLEVFYDSMIDTFREQKNVTGPVERADGIIELDRPLETFVWGGVDWTSEIVAGRLAWVVIALAVVLLAALVFRGFDKVMTRESFDLFSIFRRKKKGGKDEGWESSGGLSAKALSGISLQFSFLNLLRYELWLMLKGQKWWWYLVAIVFIAGDLLLPLDMVRSMLGPLTWVWPILIWSSMGVRELRFNTRDIVFSSMHPLERQIPATWCAGFIIALLTGIGFGLKLLLEGDLGGLFAWFVGAMFIPSLALALGIWTRTNKTFEVVLLVIMFVGVMNQLQVFDFMGSMASSPEKGMPFIYLIITVVLLAAAIIGRRNQLQR
ncbi:ABC transporter permease [Paenibacillus sambharensis]|uniref:ABC transporter permease n=1 Tax=Paenibacillus sambharensis TaxID=1803190 RepID=A0A2W1KZ63_9BACL|nr:ABC transporter permease [Paenibacillus sambharensis]PZD92948.1 ABC transporter permease [Paenibacillus sambharensis]